MKRGRKISGKIIDIAEEMYTNGSSLEDIKLSLNISTATLSKKLKSRGVEIIARNGAKRYSVNEDFFNKIDSVKKAYWFGFLMADGYIYQQRKKSDNKLKSYVRLCLSSKDKKHLEKFIDDLDYTKKDVSIIAKIDSRSGKEHEYCLVEIYSKNLVDGLIKNGCHQNKSFSIEWPNIYQEFVPHFIRGYFDGDGSVFKFFRTKSTINGIKKYHYIGVNIASASVSFINALKTALNNYGIDSYLSDGSGCKILKIKRKHNERFKILIYKDAKVYLERKKDFFDLNM